MHTRLRGHGKLVSYGTGVDIGSFTADYVRLRNGVLDTTACDSLENGVILLYNRICARANAELDILLEESEIDRILRGEDPVATSEVIALAKQEAQEFINGLREWTLELISDKVTFLGGNRDSTASADRSAGQNRAGNYCGGHQCQRQGV